ncbi:MAG: CDP-glycerol glycerophosphotransferase family protein [Chitinophagaceae bacterium]|nr:CDP-glycerol glycerophosphotransferase family protein [Chitinophagaceae bacterium]
MNFFKEYNTIQKIIKAQHQIVVYAESSHYYQYFESLLQDILKNSSIQILYLTSDNNDPLLAATDERMQVVYVKQFLGLLFPKIKADLMIMTMPDLNNFLYKRSANVRKYVYVFHAAVSTHLQYSEKAFFYYDAIFCTGAYQEREVKETEKKYGLAPKELVPYGYPLLDTIKKKYRQQIPKSVSANQRILIAPSWFESCILETCIEVLVEELSSLHYHVYIRSHPEYMKRSPKKYEALKEVVSRIPNIYFDESANVTDSIAEADILITDRSGIALEYAFGTHRPVLFVDTSLKISNPNWEKLGIEPIENSIRSGIGISVLPNELSTIGGKLKQLTGDKDKFRQQLPELEKQLFFNSPESYEKGLNYIFETMIRN